MELKYPFTFEVDGHPPKKVFATLGICVFDRKNNVIDRFYKILRLEYPSVLIAEAKGVLTAVENIPLFCNERFCHEYGNGGRYVIIGCDNRDVLDVMSEGNGSIDVLRKRRNGNGNSRELDDLEKIVEDAKEITDEYIIKWKKIDGGRKNPAHKLCREAEAELAKD